MPNARDVVIRDHGEYRAGAAELVRRRKEALRLYRPRPEILPWHLTTAREKVLRGGNRSGKTTAAVAEFASEITRIPITDWDGNELPLRFPLDEPLVFWVIGYDEKHIGKLYRKFFKPGLFRVIKDRQTNRLRAWRPWEAEDLARKHDTKPSPPLIPPRLIDPKGWAFEHKGADVFSMCRLKNGNRIESYTSGGQPGQGDAVHYILIDEDVKFPNHVSEWQARTADFDGYLSWAAWPHDKNQALHLMSERAKEDEGLENPDVFEVVVSFSGNPYIPQEAKRKRIKGWRAQGEAVLRSRDAGEFNTDSILVFPSFNIDIHGIPSSRPETQQDTLERFLIQRNYSVPLDWTNFLVLDPGHTQPAVLFAAIPPPEEFGDRVLIWDEIYVPRITPDELAELVREKIVGRVFRAFLMDYRYGRQTNVIGKTQRQIYSEAFEAKGIESQLTGSSFAYGSDDVGARNTIVRQWLASLPGTTPKFRLLADRTPAMQREFGLYKKRVVREEVREEVVDGWNHLMDCLGYLAAYDPRYAFPNPTEIQNADPVIKALRRFEQTNQPESDVFYMGAGAAPSPETLVA